MSIHPLIEIATKKVFRLCKCVRSRSFEERVYIKNRVKNDEKAVACNFIINISNVEIKSFMKKEIS